MIEMISAIIGSVVVLLLLLIVPTRIEKKKTIMIVLTSLLLAFLFKFMMGMYNFQLAMAATFLLLLCVAVIFTKSKPKKGEDDEFLVNAPGLSQPDNMVEENIVTDHSRKVDIHLDQSKIDEYIRSLSQKNESQNEIGQAENQIEVANLKDDVAAALDPESQSTQHTLSTPNIETIEVEMLDQELPFEETNENDDMFIRGDSGIETAEEEMTVEDVATPQIIVEEITEAEMPSDYDEMEDINNMIKHSIESLAVSESDDREVLLENSDRDVLLTETPNEEQIIEGSDDSKDLLYDIEIKAEPEQKSEVLENDDLEEKNSSSLETMLSDIGDFVLDDQSSDIENNVNKAEMTLEDNELEEIKPISAIFEHKSEKEDIPIVQSTNQKQMQEPTNNEDIINKRKALFEELENDLFK